MYLKDILLENVASIDFLDVTYLLMMMEHHNLFYCWGKWFRKKYFLILYC
ncbi:hypothetical protein CWATWH0401_2984 [Crocosphaera watsonii WH 0401]|uniref:Uncharacterized protein n=1 Tax=Crocosphaera watsonii WH 0401 TaxID=555881 RepID=T2J609_CROWT|nr:hypothetical protein CWATWH0401_2984 [Crocosphaera watsonii WH 0401]